MIDVTGRADDDVLHACFYLTDVKQRSPQYESAPRVITGLGHTWCRGKTMPMIEFARTVGMAVGRIQRQIAPPKRSTPLRNGRSRASALGATEDQVNMTLQSPQRIDGHGTKPEDLAGTGAHDSQGG
jgi:hypothetical protein